MPQQTKKTSPQVAENVQSSVETPMQRSGVAATGVGVAAMGNGVGATGNGVGAT